MSFSRILVPQVRLLTHIRNIVSVKPSVNTTQTLGKKRTWNIPQGVINNLRKNLLANEGCCASLVIQDRSTARFLEQNNEYISKIQSEENELRRKSLLSQLSDSKLKELLTVVVQSFSPITDLLQNIEEECIKRLRKLDINTCLYVADAFIVARYQQNHYVKNLLNYIDLNWDRLGITSAQTLQIMFLIGLYRNAPNTLFDRLGKYLESNADEYKGVELSVICHGYFASNQAIRSNLFLSTIAKKTLDDIQFLKDYHIANVLKCFRHSHYIDVEFYEKLGNEICEMQLLSDVNTLSSLGHIAHTYSSLKIQHTTLLEEVGTRAAQIVQQRQDFKPIRTKDIVKLLGCFANLQVTVPHVLTEFLMNEFQFQKDSFFQFPEVFLEGVLNLCILGHYSERLVDLVLSPNHIAFKSKRLLEQNYQMLLVDEIAKVLMPNYTRNQLPENFKQKCREDEQNLGFEISNRQGLGPLWIGLQDVLGGTRTVKCHHILSSSKVADLEILLDENEHVRSFSHESQQEKQMRETANEMFEFGNVRESGKSVLQTLLEEKKGKELAWNRDVPDIHIKQERGQKRRIVIKMLSWNQYLLNKPLVSGFMNIELTLLEKMGYEIYVINPKMAAQLSKSSRLDVQKFAKELMTTLKVKY